MKENYHILLALAWYHPELHRGINAFAREHNCHISSSMTHYTQYFPEDWQGDGIITNLWSDKHRQFAKKLKLPVVGIGKEEIGYSTIQSNHEAINNMAIDHLMERGFQNFAWYVHAISTPQLPKRYLLFKELLEKRDHKAHFLALPPQKCSIVEKQEFLINQLKALPKPLGIVAADDSSAAELVSFCLRSNFYIPEEISIIGTENDELICEGSSISLSSVEPDHFNMGYMAGERLLRQIKGNSSRTHTLVDPLEVVKRQSTDVMAVKNLEVAKALSFIKNNYLSQITIDDVVHATKISKCGLFKAFQTNLQRTPGDEILRLRIEKAKELLQKTDTPIREIALQSGFNDYMRMYKSFSRTLGRTPKEIRQANQ